MERLHPGFGHGRARQTEYIGLSGTASWETSKSSAEKLTLAHHPALWASLQGGKLLQCRLRCRAGFEVSRFFKDNANFFMADGIGFK
jgi:hypothetical protein